MRDSTTTVRISTRTRDGLKRLAERDGVTLDEAIARLVRAERQRRMGEALAAGLTDDDEAWIDAGLRTVAEVDRNDASR